MQLATFLLAFGLALRLTRLLVDDSITLPLRKAIGERLVASTTSQTSLETGVATIEQSRLWYFLHELSECPWCMGVWACAASFASAWAWADTRTWIFIAAAACASYLVGLASLVTYRLSD